MDFEQFLRLGRKNSGRCRFFARAISGIKDRIDVETDYFLLIFSRGGHLLRFSVFLIKLYRKGGERNREEGKRNQKLYRIISIGVELIWNRKGGESNRKEKIISSYIYRRRIDMERASENFQRFPPATERKDC